MLADASSLPLWHQLLLVAPALFAALAALIAGRRAAGNGWRLARAATVGMVVAALAAVAVHAATAPGATSLLRSDTVGVIVLTLVAFIGWVVVRYSATYLAGEPRQGDYLTRLLATLASVAVIVVANHLVLLVVAWTATSLALHGLLAFYRERPVAVAVAHKKFVLARLADAAMIGALVLFADAFGTLRLDRIGALATAGDVPAAAKAGAVLVAVAALLKCAQLPFHGWLIQVMEAPTPVSALLHAGVVNLGGFVLLRLAPVVDAATVARSLLVVVGASTAVAAALVMTTRVSVKVGLAWSTCAQMGFMLMQCGLGLWGMALLHLVAHSLYKAYAFLSAGETVRLAQRRALAGQEAPLTTGRLAVGALLSVCGVLVAGWAWHLLPFAADTTPALWVVGIVVALAIVPLADGPLVVRPATVALPVAYFALHTLFDRLVPLHPSAPVGLLVFTAAAFVLLFALQSVIAMAPGSRLARRLHPWCFGGFFLDDAFTRAVFSLWAPPRSASTVPVSTPA